METGLVVALGFGIALVVLAIVLTRLFGRRDFRGDANRSQADARGTATWVGVRRAGEDDLPPDGLQ